MRHEMTIFTDLDGTISEIVNDPAKARILPAAKKALKDLSKCANVAVISGRPVKDLKKRVGLPWIIYSGNHGIEIALPGGKTTVCAKEKEIEQFKAFVSEVKKSGLPSLPGIYLEDKGFSFAVHYRNAAPGIRSKALALLRRTKSSSKFGKTVKLLPGKKVMDITIDSGVNKGTAVRHILSTPVYQGSLPVYFGDDTTDLYAFKEVDKEHGINIFVSHGRPAPKGPAAPDLTVSGPEDAAELLGEFARVLCQRKV